MIDLAGRTALVTGGSRGLGLQMAHALGEAGARVVISSRKATDLEEATAELQRIIAKATAKDPDERYQGMKDLIVDLRSARRRLESAQTSAAVTPTSGLLPVPAARRRRMFVLAAVAAAVLIAAAVVAAAGVIASRQP